MVSGGGASPATVRRAGAGTLLRALVALAALAAPLSAPAVAQHRPATVERPDPATVPRSRSGPIRVIVQLALERGRALRPAATSSAAAATARRLAIQRVRSGVLARLGSAGYHGVKTFESLPLLALEVGPTALSQLAGDPAVVRIQEDRASPPLLAESVPLIGADAVWEAGVTAASTRIAILDTGIDADHPFLAGKMVAEACYSTTGRDSRSLCPGGVAESTASGSGRSCPARVFGCDHGTHVAGIAAGSRRRASGVARDGRLISIQVFSRFGGADCRDYDLPSPCALTYDSDQIRALERVLELSRSLRIAAVNMSFGGGAFRAPCDDDLRKLAIDELRAAGIAAVVASGNESYDGIVSAPACISSAVTAGSTTKADRISRFSNHAGTVDLLAPGSAIRSSVPGTGFAVFGGTSMAAPHVAGAFALLRDADPAASIDAIEMALKTTGKRLTRRRIAQPRIRIDAALGALLDAAGRPLNDDFGAAVWLAGPRGRTTGSNVGASAQPTEPIHAGITGGRSVWWRWLAPRSGTARLSTFGSDFDSVLAVYRGARLAALAEVASSDDSGGRLQSRVEFAASAGTTYRIAVGGADGAEGEIVLNYRLVPPGSVSDHREGAIGIAGAAGPVGASERMQADADGSR